MKAASFCLFLLGLWSVPAIGFADPNEIPLSRPDLDAQVGFILANPLKESDYSKSDRCVYPGRYESVEVLDTRHLLFWGRRGTVWLNQLRFECPGLDNDSVLMFEMRERNLCDMDGFHSASRAGGMSNTLSARCMLGHFESITETQAEVLRDALARARAVPPTKAAESD